MWCGSSGWKNLFKYSCSLEGRMSLFGAGVGWGGHWKLQTQYSGTGAHKPGDSRRPKLWVVISHDIAQIPSCRGLAGVHCVAGVGRTVRASSHGSRVLPFSRALPELGHCPSRIPWGD